MFNKLLTALLGVGALCLLAYWWLGVPAPQVAVRLPIEANQSQAATGKNAESTNPGTLTPGTGKPSTDAGSWPQFRGPNREAISTGTPVASSWPQGGPPVLWKLQLGEGHAGAVIHQGRVFVLDYDETKKEDVIRCLSFADGGEIWRYSYYSKIKRNHGMSRTVPAVNDQFLVTLSPKCQVLCLKPETGELVWRKDLVEEYGAKVPEWYAGQCPLIESDRVILAPGGKCLFTAIELATGKTLWETPNPDKWQMSHTSILSAQFEGRKEYVWCAAEGVAAVAAEDGALLWTLPEWRIRIATVPSPIDLGGGKILFSGGYSAGALAIQQVLKEGKISTETLFRTDPKVFGADQQTPIFHQGLIFGVIPGGKLTCLSPDGEVLWTNTEYNFGLGPFVLIDGKLLVQDDDHENPGELCFFQVDANGAKKLASAKILDGHDAWAPMAFANGKLLLRDSRTLVCLDLTRSGEEPRS